MGFLLTEFKYGQVNIFVLKCYQQLLFPILFLWGLKEQLGRSTNGFHCDSNAGVKY